MTTKVTVKEGGKIELVVPDAREGEVVEVTIHRPRQPTYTISEILERAKGHRSFESAEEVDVYINDLRDEWDR
jgi:DNA-binding response OmpR family regulator